MPAKSEKQERFMRAVAHSPSFAKKVGVPMSVGREFTKKEGGMPITYKRDVAESEKRSEESDAMKRKAVSGMKKGGMAESKAMMKKEVSFMKKKGAPKSMVKHEEAEMGMKKGGMTKKMAFGGMPVSRMAPNRTSAAPVHSVSANTPVRQNIPKDYVGSGGPKDPTSPGYVRQNYQASTPSVSPKTPKRGIAASSYGTKRMAGGGLAAGHKAADGIATKGKTKAKQVKMSGSTGMKKGGMTKMRYGGKTC